MWTAKKCCFCCCNVISASKVIVCFSFLAGLLYLVFGIWKASYLFNIPLLINYELFGWYDNIAIGINTVISIAWMISDALALYGISKKKPIFYIPWLIVHITAQLVSLKFTRSLLGFVQAT